MVVSDSLVGDLDILDRLELSNSTVSAAEALKISQSSCSRRYRSFSDLFDLGFDRVDGRYKATRNQDVLLSLRQAAQKSRVRQNHYRYAFGWQLGELKPTTTEGLGIADVPVTTMSSWTILSLLENRLIDYWIGGLMEYTGIIQKPLDQLGGEVIPLSQSLRAVPLCWWEMELVAHKNHPLRKTKELSKEQLMGYPSPAVDMGMAPTLMRLLQQKGLATMGSGLTEHDWSKWQGLAADGTSLSYAGPQDREKLEALAVSPLEHPLQITEAAGLIGHRDAIEDPVFNGQLQAICQAMHSSQPGQQSKLHWYG
jgi:DNA-binding transcriptional LysR family regulator